MKGIIKQIKANASTNDKTWILEPVLKRNSCIKYLFTSDSIEWLKSLEQSKINIAGKEVDFQLDTKCVMDDMGILVYSTQAKITFEPIPTTKVFLVDIDGTICEDIPNEEWEKFATAKEFANAKEILNNWYDKGHIITFFTARESKDRETTHSWLVQHGFKFHRLVMDKPRIKDGQEYVWIDNRKVRAVTYLGTWSDLKEVEAKIQVFS